MKKLLAVAVLCLPAFGQAAYSGRGGNPGSAVYGATVSEGSPLTYSARTDDCVHGYSTNADTVAPFYNPANETCTGAAITSISGNGSVVTITTGTAPSGATVMILCNSGSYTGGPFTISGDTTTFTYSSTATGSASGCVWQAGTGEAGSPLVFQAGASDPLPLNRLDDGVNPALANTSFTSPDFGSYSVFATDTTTVPSNHTAWSINGGGAFGRGTANDVLLDPSGRTMPYLLHIIESRVLAHTCSPATPCSVLSNVVTHAGCVPSDTNYTSPNCTHTQLPSDTLAFSRDPSDPPNTIYEMHLPYVYKDTFTSSLTGGFPDGVSDSITRTLVVDFSSNGPGGSIPCAVVPTGYQPFWNGLFDVGSVGGQFTIASAGGSPWVSGATVGLDTFINPIHNNTGMVKFAFQATTPGVTGGVEPNWVVSCPVAGNTCTDGTATWTNVGYIGSQGPGFDLFHFDPQRGCSYANTRRTKTFRGTNEGPNWPSAGTPDAAGQWITDDASTCYKMGGTSCGTGGTVNLPDIGTLHGAGTYHDGRYGHFTPTGGGAKNTNYVGGGGDETQATVGSGSCTPPIPYTTFQTWPDMKFVSGASYTNGKWVASPVDHNFYKLTGTTGTYTTDPSADSANWQYNSYLCYNYIVDWNAGIIRPELEVGPTYAADGHGQGGYALDFRGGKYISHNLSQPQCQNTTGTCAGQYIGAPYNPGVFALTISLPADGHPDYGNEGPYNGQRDKQPIPDQTADVFASAGVGRMPAYSGTPGNSAYTSAGYDEILAFSTDGLQTLYRFGSTYNTGSSIYFAIQNAQGSISQDGKMFAWCSDFNSTRGDDNTNATTCVNPVVAMYAPSTGGCVALNDYVKPTSGNAGGYIYKITSLGSAVQGSCASLYTEGTMPTWNQSVGTDSTDTVGIVFHNAGINSCRSDIAVMDVTRAQPAP
jgi:hypothetical protein